MNARWRAMTFCTFNEGPFQYISELFLPPGLGLGLLQLREGLRRRGHPLLQPAALFLDHFDLGSTRLQEVERARLLNAYRRRFLFCVGFRFSCFAAVFLFRTQTSFLH